MIARSGGKTSHFAMRRRTLPSAGILLELVAGVHLFTCLLSTRPQAIIAHLDERCSQQLAVLAPLLAARSGAAQLFLVGGYGPRGESVAEEILKACLQGQFGRTSHNCKSARCTPSVAATVALGDCPDSWFVAVKCAADAPGLVGRESCARRHVGMAGVSEFYQIIKALFSFSAGDARAAAADGGPAARGGGRPEPAPRDARHPAPQPGGRHRHLRRMAARDARKASLHHRQC